MNKNVRILMAVMVFAFAKAYSQQTEPKTYSFSLEEAIVHGLENNYQTINAKTEIAKALKQKWITTATGLPQINGTVDYQYQIIQPVTPLPGEIAGGEPGTFVPVTFSPKQSANLSATLSQLIFDGSYIVALEASKTFIDFSKNAENKTKLEVRKGIINAYGAVLLTQENIAIITSNRDVLKTNLNETVKIYENGLTEEENVEQLRITLAQLENQLNNAQRQESIAMDMLKLALGIDLKDSLTLTENLDSIALLNMTPAIVNESLDLDKNADYQIAFNFTEQRRLEYKLERAKYLPTLSGFVNLGTQSFGDDFTFFNNNNRWFAQSITGLSLNVPIFSSFGRKASVAKAKLAWDQANVDFTRTQEEIRLNYEMAQANYKNAVDNYMTSKENLRLAERIENKNNIKFKEGLSTSFDLRQAQTQLYSTQSQYLQSLYSLITEKATLETILNTPQFTNTQN
ncbi:MAG: TolC family protein [Nonlabens sp.]|nr:TolC family protein [Nonlabens sp.]MDP5101890.1 TolC family protein [Nonlabens sp.]